LPCTLRAELIATGVLLRTLLDLRLPFLAEFLEARILAERIEHRIEPKERGSERHILSERGLIWY